MNPTDERTEWGDRRLDELARRVEQCATHADVNNLRRDLTERGDRAHSELQKVGRKVEELIGDPVSERRARRQALFNWGLGIVGGSTVTIIGFLISQGHL